jgi:hypothetical protein
MTQQDPDTDARGTQGEETQGAGRASRGPAVHPGGETEMGGPVPMTPGPYDERKHSADDLDTAAPDADATVGGATGPRRTDAELTSERPEDTPGGRTGSPADEQPATEFADQEGEAVTATGPAHYPGTSRGEEYGTGEAPERGRAEVDPDSGANQ